MKTAARLLILLVLLGALYVLLTRPCWDGSRTWSRRSGACSHHGGLFR